MKRITTAVVLGFAALLLAGCTSDAETVSRNLSTEADQFKVVRRIVVTNTWNGETLWEATGRWASTQLESVDVSRYHTTIVFKPTAVVPNVDISVAAK